MPSQIEMWVERWRELEKQKVELQEKMNALIIAMPSIQLNDPLTNRALIASCDEEGRLRLKIHDVGIFLTASEATTLGNWLLCTFTDFEDEESEKK